MTCAFPLLWLLFVIIMWVGAIQGFQDASLAADTPRRAKTRVCLWAAAIPPTFVFLVTAFVLTLSSPCAESGESFGVTEDSTIS